MRNCGDKTRPGRPSKKRETRRGIALSFDWLEDRTVPAPFASTGVWGDLAPASSVTFDTTSGTYSVDGGAPISGGSLSTDPGQSTMLFNFASITLDSGVSVTATGSYALGLLGTG